MWRSGDDVCTLCASRDDRQCDLSDLWMLLVVQLRTVTAVACGVRTGQRAILTLDGSVGEFERNAIVMNRTSCAGAVARVALVVAMCTLLPGCVARTYTFNARSYTDYNRATAAVEAFYVNIENKIKPVSVPGTMTLAVVIPSKSYARSNWVRVRGRGHVTELQYQFIVGQLIRDWGSVATCLRKARAFASVEAVHAPADSIAPPSFTDINADLVLKKIPSGAWALVRVADGKTVDVPLFPDLSGADFMAALVAAVQEKAKSLAE